MASAITVEGVSKRFRLYREQYSSLKERVIHLGRAPYEEFWALRDIGFDIPEGTTLGLLGHNGSGKSTLLKCIAGILRPTSGCITTRGRVVALLELGAGFHPELTGRENVYLNGTLLGMSKREIERRFDDIVAFSELEQFIDTQVRFYSSGMYVRLGFAVAVNVDPHVLLVDEVLAVGDEAFQRKCLERVGEFQAEGRTIVVVTHAPELVAQVCQQAAVLDHGNLVTVAEPRDAVRAFRESLRGAQAASAHVGDHALDNRLQITGVQITDPVHPDRDYVTTGDPLEVRIDVDALVPVDDPVFTIMIHTANGRVVHSANSTVRDLRTGHFDGQGRVVFAFDHLLLHEGEHQVTVTATAADGSAIYDWHEQRYALRVGDPSMDDATADDVAYTVSVEPHVEATRAAG